MSSKNKLKQKLVEKYPDRYTFDKAGNLREIKSDGKTKPMSNANFEAAVEEMVDNTRFGGALSKLLKALSVVGVVFTAIDLYNLYEIYTDDTLSDDDRVHQSGPIIGRMLGGWGGAVIGALGGGAVAGPWGAFFGGVAGGITGSVSGHIIGEVVAEYIVGDPPPRHPSGKDWDQLTSMEIESWWAHEATMLNRSYIDSTSTQETQPQSFPTTTPQFEFDFLHPPDAEDPPGHESLPSQDGPIKRENPTDLNMIHPAPPPEPVNVTMTDMKPDQYKKINDMLENYISVKREHEDTRTQILDQIRTVNA